MLTCIPANSDAGRDATLSDHFGSAPYFHLYDSEAGSIETIANRNAHHDHGTCHPMNQLAHHQINAIVCRGIGRRAIEALNAEGITCLQTDGKTVGEAIDDLKDGRVTEIDPARACRGHGQHHQFTQAHFSGEGRGAGWGQGPGRGQGGGQGSAQGGGRGRRS